MAVPTASTDGVERLGASDAFSDFALWLLRGLAASRGDGWEVHHTRAFGGQHLVIASHGAALELRGVGDTAAEAALEVIPQLERWTAPIGADVQLPLPFVW